MSVEDSSEDPESAPEPAVVLGDGKPVALASPVARAVARFIDSLIHAGLGFGGLILIFLATFCIWCATHETNGGQVTLGVLLVAAWAFYEPVLVAWRGQTLGKAVCAVKVVRVADGHPPNFGLALVRWTIPFVAGAALLPALVLSGVEIQSDPLRIAAILAMWAPLYLTSFLDSDRRRGWHDKAAGTVVIASRPRAQPG